MRRLAVMMLGCGLLLGQAPESPWLTPLGSGSLTIWIVAHNPNPAPRPRLMTGQGSAPGVPVYQEKTMAEFGQTAGSVGQTAGSVGQTVGSFGDTAGSVGQTAGSTGQTAGSYGTAASNVGKNAGDAGQTVGSFGVSTTDLPAAAASANAIRTRGPGPKRDPRWAALLSDLAQHFPRLQVQVADVFDDELQARLDEVAGTRNAPDILLGNPLPTGWSRTNQALVSLGQETRLPQTEEDAPVGGFEPEAAILTVRGHSPDAARAFYVWLADGDRGPFKPQSVAELAAGTVAARVLRGALQGDPLGSDADPQMAGLDQQQVRAMLAKAGQGRFQVEVTAEHVHNGFAVVTLRGVEAGTKAFGLVHALVVLRKDQAGHWEVLHVSPFLTRSMLATGYDFLSQATMGKESSNPLENESAKPLGIAQASPADGEFRSPMPELWWDNLGGSSIQVVEWTAGGGGSNLFFVKDNDPTLKTRVVARFARTAGRYRWRVWSVGADGTVVLSAWRGLIVVGK